MHLYKRNLCIFYWKLLHGSCISCFSSVQSLSHIRFSVTPWTAVLQASLSITNSWSLLKLMSIESVMPSNHLILCHPLLLLSSIFPSTRVFSSESVLCISDQSIGVSASASVLTINIQDSYLWHCQIRMCLGFLFRFWNFIYFFSLLILHWGINNVVIVSGEQWRDSVIHKQVSILLQTPLSLFGFSFLKNDQIILCPNNRLLFIAQIFCQMSKFLANFESFWPRSPLLLTKVKFLIIIIFLVSLKILSITIFCLWMWWFIFLFCFLWHSFLILAFQGKIPKSEELNC